ncbi:YtzC family protein [Lederbergia lenta]|uniref:YtzC protein n=1 Tax=Lederbergia lenta TaxID=1467 RepID=A0A2X4ZLC7_LEDLE|nr:YtzC family protein [Lederbergia lenta]MCM3113413.1 YtzC family protein [Lederbergia lenta]MEC2326442.1 YtzC family protein [Lederbergia lenta]SQI61254.1 YtzC protein [Lederbergia lenta]
MATRQSIEDCMNRCESAILVAEEQYNQASRQEHYYDVEFSEAQQQLETAVMEIEKLSDSSNAQQREQLYRTRLKVQQLQNKMMVTNHDHPLTWQ